MSVNLEKETKIVNGKYIYIDDAKKDYIQNISIDTNIKQDSREGYNELDTSNYELRGVLTNLNCERQDDGSFIINGTTGTAGADIKIISNKPLITLKAGTHTFYFGDTPIDNMYNCELNLTTYGLGTYTLIKKIAETINYKTITLTEDLEIYNINYHLAVSATYNNFVLKPMIYEGAYDVNKVFEQYGSMPSIEFPSEIKTPVGKQEVVIRNKNYFNKDNANIVGGMFSNSGFVEGQITSNKTCYVKIKPNKAITVSKILSSKFAVATATDIPKNNAIPTTFIRKDSNTDITVTSGTNDNYLWVWFWNKDNDTNILEDLLNSIQIEEGTVPTAYTSHQSQTQDLDLTSELLGTIVDKEDGAYFENRYNRIILTGDEKVGLQKISNNIARFDVGNIFTGKVNTNLDVFCNYLKNNTTELENTIRSGVDQYINTCVIYVNSSIASTPEEMKAWIKEKYNNGTPLEILYKLATPTYTKLTDEQQTQWNKIKKMHTYEGVTNIYTINENGISPILDLEYTTKYAEEYDFYIDENARFIVPEYDINYQVSIPESDLSDMPEASESAVKIAGKDGDVVLNTTYEPKDFNIVAYTDDNLEPKDKEAEKTKLVNFLHSIKNRTKNFGLLYREKFYPVKYNDKLTPTIYPKSIRFEIPIKSSKSLGYSLEKKMIFGNGKEISNTIEETGCKIIIEGPIYGTNDSPMVITLNDYQMAYYNTVLEGNRLEIDTNNSTIKHISSNGEVTNVAAYYNHEYPKIKYGENEIKILSKIDSETQVYTEWYDLKI